MKRFLSAVLAGMMTLSLLAGCGGSGDTQAPAADDTNTPAQAEDNGQAAEGLFPAVAKEDIKVGVVHITDPAEGSGYTYTHDLGIQGMQKNLGLSDDQIIRKINVDD